MDIAKLNGIRRILIMRSHGWFPLSVLLTVSPVLVSGSALAQALSFRHLAGPLGGAGMVDGPGSSAEFFVPYGVAVDSAGNVYVADSNNNAIRRITPDGVVTTLAGSGIAGSADGQGAAASFNVPRGVAVDGSGNVYVADTYNHKIRKITPGGVVTTLAGSGSSGTADETGAAASFFFPNGVAVDGSGNVYVADFGADTVRKVTPAGVVTKPVPYPSPFSYPGGVAVDGSGNVYVTTYDSKIKKMTPDGVVTMLAGSGSPGSADGQGTAASFHHPGGVAVDGSGNVYVADTSNNTIRKITPSGLVTTLAGSGRFASEDGTGAAASFAFPTGVATDASGNVYVGFFYENKIRKITPGGVVTTLAG